MTVLAQLGGTIGCTGAALALAGRGQLSRLAGLGGVGLGCALLGVALAPSADPVLVIGAVALVGVALALGLGARRWPWALAFLSLVAIPGRIPIDIGGDRSTLLLPLQVLAVSAGFAMIVDRLKGDTRERELEPLSLPLAGLLLWSGLSLWWTNDVARGADALLSYYLPFAMIALFFARLPWSRRALSWLAGSIVALGLAYTAIGLYQYATRNVFWNPKVIVGDAYASFYRVNSLFWNPSSYGRFLTVAIIAALVVVVLGRSLRLAALSAAAIVVLSLGLLLSYSQSSFVGLLIATLVLTAVVWRPKLTLALSAIALVLVVAGLFVAGSRDSGSIATQTERAGLARSTSGRAPLISNGIRIAADHPLLGVGMGGFPRAYVAKNREHGKAAKPEISHTTPIRLAAEGGIVALVLYLWLIGALLVTTLRRVGELFEDRAAFAFGLVGVSLVVYSLAYDTFFDDPMTWRLFGLVALVTATAPAAAIEPIPAAAQPEPELEPEPEPALVASEL